MVFAGGVSRFVTAKQKIELFHPDILSGGVSQKAVQLNSTLFTLDVKRDLMSTLHKLKKGKSVVITAEDALRFGLATDIKPFQTVIELNDCKLTAKPDLCQSDHAAKKTVKPKAYHRLSSEFWFALSARVVVSDRPHNSNAAPFWLALDGRIMPNTDQVVETYYKQLAPLKPTAVINSPGGDLGAAYRLAMFFKREGINTAFGLTRWSACDNPKDCRIRGSELDYQRGAIDHNSVCEGACLIAFAGGRKRMTGGSTAAKLNDLQSLNMFSTVKVSGTELAAMFDAIGSGPELAQKVTQFPEGEAIFLNEQQLAESGLVNTTDRTGILADADKCAPREGPVVCLPPK